MTRLVALLAGYAALLVFLAALGNLFAREERDSLEEIDGRRDALEQYASAALARRLHEKLAAVEPRLDAALKDPLVDAEGALAVVDGTRLLPPPQARPVPQALEADDEASELPFVEAVRAAKDDAAVERAVRGLLAHRARWRVPVLHDCEAVAQVVELLLPRASPTLLSGLLRDGLPGQEGLQRRLLRARTQLLPAELEAWCHKLTALSRRAQVPADDFQARCQAPGVPDEELPEVARLPEGPSQLDGWYLERAGAVVRGVRVDLRAERADIDAQMRELGLRSGDWEAARQRAHGLLRLKAGLLAFIGLLGLSLLALAQLAQRRKLRFVEMKEDFVAAVSHELKTPLASMRVMAETLEHRLQGHAPAKDYPRRLVAEVDQLHGLVENILSFNRLDKGRWQPLLSSFSLAELVPALEQDGGASLSFEGFEATVRADRELLALCLLNLLRNARRYNTRAPVTVSFEYDARARLLRVRDNGIGIPPAQWRRVFDDFVRLKALPRPGTGLGLSLCKRVMALHGGSIEVESSSPEGTTFALRFGPA